MWGTRSLNYKRHITGHLEAGGTGLCCAESCPTLCNLMDCSLSSSCVHGISQAGTLEWVAISSSRVNGAVCCILTASSSGRKECQKKKKKKEKKEAERCNLSLLPRTSSADVPGAACFGHHAFAGLGWWWRDLAARSRLVLRPVFHLMELNVLTSNSHQLTFQVSRLRAMRTLLRKTFELSGSSVN